MIERSSGPSKRDTIVAVGLLILAAVTVAFMPDTAKLVFMEPIAAILLAAWIFNERLNPGQWAGILSRRS